MKTSLLSLIAFFVLSTIQTQAQYEYNTIFFTENGESFWVILNGVRQNQHPETNVKVTGLNAPMYKLKVIFEDKSLGELSKNLMLPEESSEVAFNIKKGKKGDYVLRYFSQVPISTPAPAAPEQQTVFFSTTEQFSANPWMETTVTETVVVADDPLAEEHINMNVDVNFGGIDIGMNVNVNDEGHHHSETHTTTTKTTTHTHSHEGSFVHEEVVETHEPGCVIPMNAHDFEEAKSMIASKTFDDSKQKMAQQVASGNCLSANQVLQLTKLLEYESSKLEFAKFAFDGTMDKGNYFKVNDAFEFESSIEELDEYISGR